MSKRLTYVRKEYKESDITMLVGIIEGEGSIYIGNFSCNPKTGLPYYQTNMQVTNTGIKMIEWLEKTFGGLVNKRSARQHPENSRKQAYVWTVSGELLTHLCELMLPYMLDKKRQVEIMLEMRATYTKNGAIKGKQGTQELSIDIRLHRQKLMDEMRSLHIRTHSYKNTGHLPRVTISN